MPVRNLALILVLLPLAVMAQSAPPSDWHGDGHVENHDRYKTLKQRDIGVGCCNGREDGKEGSCRPNQAYLRDDGMYRTRDGRGRLVVPKDRIISMPPPDRRPRLCETFGLVFCCITGEPVS